MAAESSRDEGLSSVVVCSYSHPLHLLRFASAVLHHTVSSFNPNTLIVRRIHHRRATDQRHGSRDEGESEANPDPPTVAAGAAASRRSYHSPTPNGEAAARPRSGDRRSRRSIADGETKSRSSRGRDSVATKDSSTTTPTRTASATSNGSAEAPATSSARRTRSAEEPLSRRRRGSDESEKSQGSVRRSLSDTTVSRSRRASVTQSPSSSTSVPPAAAASSSLASSQGVRLSLAPPPPVSDIGKPPLSARHPLTASSRGDLSATAMMSSGNTSSTSMLGSRSSRGNSGDSASHRRRRRSSTDGDEGSSSEIYEIRPAERSWSLASWWQRIRQTNVTRAAYLFAHMLREVPVTVVHYCCGLRLQMAALPLLHFPDTQNIDAAASRHGSPPAAVVPGVERIMNGDPAELLRFLALRWVLKSIADYLEAALFFDDGYVVRQLRSKRYWRRFTGWSIRIASHTLLDAAFLGVVGPLFMVQASSASAAPSPPSSPDEATAFKLTLPGLLRGLALSGAGVVVQWLWMPFFSQLVDRAVVTVFEAVEYVVMRRYVAWPNEEDEDEEEEEEDTEEVDGNDAETSLLDQDRGEAVSVRSGTTVAASRRDGADPNTTDDRLRRRLRRQKLRRRQERLQRQEQRDRALHQAVMRAIFYRIAGSVVAQCLVNHPCAVLVELLRGRAMLHFTGLLDSYADISPVTDGVNLANVVRYAAMSVGEAPLPPAIQATVEAEVPQLLTILRFIGSDVAHEVRMISSSVLAVSGEAAAIHAVQQRAQAAIAAEGTPKAVDAAELLYLSLRSLSPFFAELPFSIADKLLSFYMSVWTRLRKQER